MEQKDMEQKWTAAWTKARREASALGVKLRPVDPDRALAEAHRCLAGHRPSDGFSQLAALGHSELTVEALAVDRRFTALFSDAEANRALERLLEAGYRFYSKRQKDLSFTII